MPDLFDEAQAADALFRRQALDAQRRRLPTGESLTYCLECGREIPEARRRLLPGIRCCVHCAERIEREERR